MKQQTGVGEKDTFTGDYLTDLKKILKKSVNLCDSIRGTDIKGIHIALAIEDMQEIVDYCNELDIMDVIILHDETDKKYLKDSGIVLVND